MRLRTALPAFAAMVILSCAQPVADRDAPSVETLSAEALSDCLWALENVSYEHRSWPRENGVPKPPLEAVLQKPAGGR